MTSADFAYVDDVAYVRRGVTSCVRTRAYASHFASHFSHFASHFSHFASHFSSHFSHFASHSSHYGPIRPDGPVEGTAKL
jgi:hypothetical protein